MESLHNEYFLIDAMRAGSEEAFTVLYLHYSPQLYLNILGVIRDPLWAEEMVQELFTRVWQKRDSKGLKENFPGYLYRTGQHMVFDFFRNVKRDKKLQERFKFLTSEYYEHIEEGFDHKQLTGMLNQAVEQLSSQQKKAYQLVKIDGNSYKQAAEIMGISPLTVKEYLSNSHKSIRNYIINNTGDEIWVLLLLILISTF